MMRLLAYGPPGRFVSRLITVLLLVGIHGGSRTAPLPGTPVRAGEVSVTAAGKTFRISLVRVKLDQARIRVGLAGGQVGCTEDLAGIAGRYGADAAINASFFDAYTDSSVKKPYHTVITGGHEAFVGYVGTIVGVDSAGVVRMERATRVMEERRVRGEAGGFWTQVQEAAGAGPRLLKDGRIALDPVGEGFRSPKILKMSAARSAVGVTKDGWLLLATTNATVVQLAHVMKALGAEQAMNLDGGASSGLWVRGRYLRRPGRRISNALLVIRKI